LRRLERQNARCLERKMSNSPRSSSCHRPDVKLSRFLLAGLALLLAGLTGCGSGSMSLAAGRITISGLTPASGPVSGGNVVRILGTGFKGNTTVHILQSEAR